MSLEPVAARLDREFQARTRAGDPITGVMVCAVVAGWLEEWANRRSRHWGSDSTLQEVVATLRADPWTLQVLENLPPI